MVARPSLTWSENQPIPVPGEDGLILRSLRFVDLESSMSIVTEPSSVRDEYLRQFNLFLEQLRGGCNEFGVDYRQVVTDQDYERVLADFLIERAHLAAASP